MVAHELILRPVRPGDRERVVELTSDIWAGHDYLPRVFERWVADAGAFFQAAELDGTLVGLHRLRPYAPGLIWYEGLRVASSHRRQGIARSMLNAAIELARELDFRELRLATLQGDAAGLFDSAGLERRITFQWWRAPRLEGGDVARHPPAAEATKLWAGLAASPGIELYRGMSADLNGARDLGSEELGRLAGAGMLRAGPGGRAIATLRDPWSQSIAVSFVAGAGGALRELLMALRYEADADGVERVAVTLPMGHPAEVDLQSSGYDSVDDELGYVYALRLQR